MGVLWRRTAEKKWSRAPLAVGPQSATSLAAGVRLVSFGEGPLRIVALLSSETQVWVSGRPLVGGLAVLRDRDEILVDGERIYYSCESQPHVDRFHAVDGERPPKCAVCRMALEEGQTIVHCPNCGRAYHQLEAAGEQAAKQCFTYRPQCLCGHPTSLSGEPTWRPEIE
jgi:hypothetical protein